MAQVISILPNAARFIERWGLHDRKDSQRIVSCHLLTQLNRLWPICGHAPALNLHNHFGDLILVQPLPEREYGSQAYNGHRGQIHQIIFDHAKSLGVDIRLGQSVTEFWESGEGGIAGVVSNGETILADLVVGADGVRSKARELILVRQISSCFQ